MAYEFDETPPPYTKYDFDFEYEFDENSKKTILKCTDSISGKKWEVRLSQKEFPDDEYLDLDSV